MKTRLPNSKPPTPTPNPQTANRKPQALTQASARAGAGPSGYQRDAWATHLLTKFQA